MYAHEFLVLPPELRGALVGGQSIGRPRQSGDPEIHLQTNKEDVNQCISKILDHLRQASCL